MSEAPSDPAAVTARVTRGARRLLGDLGYATLDELPLPDGHRADVMALAADGGFAIAEVKSGLPDYRADSKWSFYRDYCDLFYFAVDERFPLDVLEPDVGIIIADGFGGAIVRPAPVHRLAGARRKALTLRFARAAARRAEGLAEGLAEGAAP
ncbi:MAG: MmcB family DNA repair protein [Caulobacterales bacterium]|nr:MmcB family DNA repair protein [Caulobacterales bacterium]